MPTMFLDAWGRRNGEVVDLRVGLPDGTVIARQVTWSKVETPAKLAQWVLDQAVEPGVDVLHQQFTVDFHLDGSGGLVVDAVTAAGLPEDTAWSQLAGSALGTVTVAEAVATIKAAASLADVKAILANMARLVIPMRDVVQRLLAGLRRLGLR